jgi:hypothetical protein
MQPCCVALFRTSAKPMSALPPKADIRRWGREGWSYVRRNTPRYYTLDCEQRICFAVTLVLSENSIWWLVHSLSGNHGII